MNALQVLFRPLVAMMNRKIKATTPARELCEEIDGRTAAVRVRDTGLAMTFRVNKGGIETSAEVDNDPDVVITGTLVSLARLAGPAGEDLIRNGEIDLTGDALLAQRFRRLMQLGRPDIEEELSGVVGDIVAHSAGNAARSFARWSGEVRDTMTQNIGEYLTEERHAVPGRYEIEAFGDEVNRLRDDVARFEARLKRIESATGPST